jgi:hypothetical protein
LIYVSVIHAENLLLNAGAEQGKGDEPSVWSRASVPADGLQMKRTISVAHAGKASLEIANEHEYDEVVANNWMQSLQEVPKGATIRVRAAIRTANADSANVCLQCWDITREKMLAFASTPVFRGDQDWIVVSSGPIIVPVDTAEIIVRAALAGLGHAWFDELAVVAESSTTRGENSARDNDASTDAQPLFAPQAPSADVTTKQLQDKVPGQIVESIPVSQDSMVLAYLPDWSHGNVDNIAVANNDGGVRTLIAWKRLPAKAISAGNRRFFLAVYSRKTTLVDGAGRIQVCPITQKWPELTSWKNQPQIDESADAISVDFAPGNGWKVFDVTPLVTKKTTANRFGVMLKFLEESQSGQKQNWSGYEFASREGLGEWEGLRPRLLVVE